MAETIDMDSTQETSLKKGSKASAGTSFLSVCTDSLGLTQKMKQELCNIESGMIPGDD